MANMSVQLNMNSDDRSADFQLPSLSDNDYHHKRLRLTYSLRQFTVAIRT